LASERHIATTGISLGQHGVMREVFDGRILVEHFQAYIASSRVLPPDPTNGTAGQANGLCGARIPGFLYLVVGSLIGSPAFRVEAHDDNPPLGEEWEDAVEVSYLPSSAEVFLVEWCATWYPLDLPCRRYRVRYCARGMDDVEGHVGPLDDEPVVDSYLLQFWPDDHQRPDEIVRQTSAAAAYWNRSSS
jgi:hypothetical protein